MISLGIFKPDKNHQNPKEKNMEQEFKKIGGWREIQVVIL